MIVRRISLQNSDLLLQLLGHLTTQLVTIHPVGQAAEAVPRVREAVRASGAQPCQAIAAVAYSWCPATSQGAGVAEGARTATVVQDALVSSGGSSTRPRRIHSRESGLDGVEELLRDTVVPIPPARGVLILRPRGWRVLNEGVLRPVGAGAEPPTASALVVGQGVSIPNLPRGRSDSQRLLFRRRVTSTRRGWRGRGRKRAQRRPRYHSHGCVGTIGAPHHLHNEHLVRCWRLRGCLLRCWWLRCGWRRR